MAIAVTNPAVAHFGWYLNATSVDLSGAEVLKTGIAGQRICVRHLTISSAANISITIGQGETHPAVTLALLGPIIFAANQQMQWTFGNGGMLLATAEDLTCDSSGAGDVTIFGWGIMI